MTQSASITLSNIQWSTPEGKTLFSDLNLQFARERTGLIGRNGVGKSTFFSLITGELKPHTGKISVCGKVGILRQTVQKTSDQTIADLFGARDMLDILVRAENGLATADELAQADWTIEEKIQLSLSKVGLNITPNVLTQNLSGGQRTRAALAALLFKQPDFLLLDEPTNNLDQEGRDAVIQLLSSWTNGAVIISHDRQLLESMDAIVELTSIGATRYGGNWSHYRSRKEIDIASAQKDLSDAEKLVNQAAHAAQQQAERKARKDSAGKAKRAKGDTPKILLGGMKSRSETTSGNNSRLADIQKQQAEEKLDDARKRIEVLQKLSIALPSSKLHKSKNILTLENVSVGYEPQRSVIEDLSFTVTGPERISIKGKNGSGKTTLLSLITGSLQPYSGKVTVSCKWAMLDQSVSILDPDISVLENFRRINPNEDDNSCRAALARFMFRADTAKQKAGTLSGGQLLRAGLACTLGSSTPPMLLVLDEPTNHLDIESIEILEAGLRAYDGALIVVSHDTSFLSEIGITRTISL